ncbi:hypothetical protein QBC47DRAFT_391597 [Echria macrotheca]|uniref:Uncharacterized protein n=1 Tax=Echria macrotheca TaxID=438768 RepID=A0AAJ0F1J7_9PEZI|nr:hypothetical protein QBC47DRAFT_391597 [Echria macrotheca]
MYVLHALPLAARKITPTNLVLPDTSELVNIILSCTTQLPRFISVRAENPLGGGTSFAHTIRHTSMALEGWAPTWASLLEPTGASVQQPLATFRPLPPITNRKEREWGGLAKSSPLPFILLDAPAILPDTYDHSQPVIYRLYVKSARDHGVAADVAGEFQPFHVYVVVADFLSVGGAWRDRRRLRCRFLRLVDGSDKRMMAAPGCYKVSPCQQALTPTALVGTINTRHKPRQPGTLAG